LELDKIIFTVLRDAYSGTTAYTLVVVGDTESMYSTHRLCQGRMASPWGTVPLTFTSLSGS